MHKNTFVISMLLWLGLFLVDTMTACSAVETDALQFTPDTQAPVIAGVEDRLLYQSDALQELDITVTDDRDEAPKLTVDDSGVRLDKPGVYEVTYTAEDEAGNRTKAVGLVTVLEKKEGYVSMETVFKAVDSQLEKIVTQDMGTREQIGRIYDWARESFSYRNHSDKSDPYQAAYRMLTDRSGDCYSYFSVCKLMFDRLGIPNIDVQKVPNSPEDSQHFWSLVSVDGGLNFYHFDATPRIGGGDDFCMVTDAFLDAYSESHSFSHNRDTSLYPPTPKA